MSSNVLRVTRIETRTIIERDGIQLNPKEIQEKTSKGLVYDEISNAHEYILYTLISLEKIISNANITYQFEMVDLDKLRLENFNRRINGLKEIQVNNISDYIKSYASSLKSISKVIAEFDKEIGKHLMSIIIAANDNNTCLMERSAKEISSKLSYMKNK